MQSDAKGMKLTCRDVHYWPVLRAGRVVVRSATRFSFFV
jgi:hypothetical protein